MESPLPFALRVAAGMVAESVDAIRRLPTEVSTLPVSVMGRLAKLSFQVNQQLTDLAASGDRLLAGMNRDDEPPERTAWATIDDEDEVAASDPQAAATWDSVAEAVDQLPDATPPPPRRRTRSTTAKRTATGTPLTAVPSTVEGMTRDLVEDVGNLEDEPPAPSTRTLAQLRSAVRTMSVDELRAALDAEERDRARPAHLTLLTNRLATLSRAEE